ncbi:hypothetical protein [Pseudomonas sp. EpS/L25]|uniref:hypothetical protein n=1 Tax=Pseudomonas sp. EpS/L25 TaxID=1749078 RepID=UPI0007432EC6|nr:hypothetical protein [Pseudomonas sp. EpS/L25]KUM40056.1 hypothetical protein AR540_12195 [Pseudomonas sp. EpS/L25]
MSNSLWRSWLKPRSLLAFAAALLLAAAWGSLVQTQYNLAALQGLELPIDGATRWRTSLQDLLGFGPVYAAIVLAAWLPAFAAAFWLARRSGPYRACLLPLATSVSLIVAIRLIDAFAPIPVLIYATRTLDGLLAMAVGGLLGGLLFIWLARPRPTQAKVDITP